MVCSQFAPTFLLENRVLAEQYQNKCRRTLGELYFLTDNSRQFQTFSDIFGPPQSLLFIWFFFKDLECKVATITQNQLQFTGTAIGSSPKITETYYLSR
jgi:hypothetical protein